MGKKISICGYCKSEIKATGIGFGYKLLYCYKCKKLYKLPYKVNKIGVDSINKYWVELHGD